MRIANQWVGWGLGDSDEEVRKIKSFMRKKLSYAKDLRDTSLYDQQMLVAVAEMQRRYNAGGTLPTGKYSPGIINFATKVAMGFVPPPPKIDTRPVLLTVCGTGVPWWVGPDADTARAVESQYLWQPIGYPAKPVPMGPSIQAARDEMFVQMNKHRDRITKYGCAWAGYSQGALAISESWTYEVLPENGRLAWAKPHLKKAVTWGNPMRQRGSVWPDAGAPPSPQENGGVTPTLMVAPPFWRDYAHKNDLYADVPPDESGENRTAIWQLIRNGNVMSGPDSILRQFLELGGISKDAGQLAEGVGLVKAMLDALIFFGKGTQPHVNYSSAEAIAYLRSVK
jgi:hypothetical protein